MKLVCWISTKPRRFLPALVCATALLSALVAQAQIVGVSDPAPNSPPPNLRPLASGDGATDRATAPFQWGSVSLRPHALYRLTNADGIQSAPGIPTETTINTFSPGLLLEIGRRWTVDYTPTWTNYSHSGFDDAFEHELTVLGNALFTDGSIHFSQEYDLTDSPRIETGFQTKQETSVTSLDVNYELSRKTRIEVGLNQDLRWVESAPNSFDWSIQGLYHYIVSERLDIAGGFGMGYTAVDPGTDMFYTRPQVRVGWKPTGKLSFDAHYGRETREFDKDGAVDLNIPNYGVAAFYQPFEYTTLSLGASRSVSASYFSDQVTDNETLSLGLSQRLFRRLNFNASANQTDTQYLPSGAPVISVIREDTSYRYNLRLSTSFLRRGTIGVVYQYTRNSTNAEGFGFSNNEIGLEISYAY